MEKIRLGILGLGVRGRDIMHLCAKMPDVHITAVCDLYLDKALLAEDECQILHGYKPFYTTDYKEVIYRDDIDAVVIATSWEDHIPLAIEIMRAGKPVGMEVGGAYSLKDCFELVRVQEETGTPFMFLENCCFDEIELIATSMVRNGVYGELVQCEGGYPHDLRDEVLYGNRNRHYRLRNYMHRNCENYPTHELGPIAKLLNINRGNRMVSLVSIATKSAGIKEYIRSHPGEIDEDLVDKEFMQGDIVDTIITCAHGETIHIKLDTCLPENRTRGFTVRGTKACSFGSDFFKGYTDDYSRNLLDYKEYMPLCWSDMTEEGRQLGHGGMDGIEFRTFINCVKNNTPMPIDVYDAAALMCISCLSEASIAQGGKPQEIPDFTHGQWMIREPLDVVEFPKVDNN